MMLESTASSKGQKTCTNVMIISRGKQAATATIVTPAIITEMRTNVEDEVSFNEVEHFSISLRNLCIRFVNKC